MVQSGVLNMFARSPIRPLQCHMEEAQTCAALLLPYFNAVIDKDWDKASAIQEDISEHEQKADELKMDFRLHLPKDLFLPVPRLDLLDLLSKQELIANLAKDIAGIVLGRKMEIPTKIAEKFRSYLEYCIKSTTQAKKVIDELDELLESGFRGKEVHLIEKMIQKINQTECDSDQLQISLRQGLYIIEKTLSPIDAIFLYQVIEKIGLLADCAQKVGSRLRMLTA